MNYCPYCDTEFSVDCEDEMEVMNCPFCGEELPDEDDSDHWLNDDEDGAYLE